jgi:transcriptional regulator GlxA family with amidase domain
MVISIPLPESRLALISLWRGRRGPRCVCGIGCSAQPYHVLRRPGGQAQFSVSLSTQASVRRALQDLQVWMAENLNKNLSVDVLARRAAMSPRNFSRVFRKETGITPAKFAERLRVEAARRQLEQTVKAVKEIAVSCGFSSSEIMRRTFLSQLQVTPSAYRLRFQRRSPPGTSRS